MHTLCVDHISESFHQELAGRLYRRGYATIPGLISPAQCRELIEAYGQSERFRTKIIMSRHSFGRGEYQYFDYPLPRLVAELRAGFYRRLAPIARDWSKKLHLDAAYPDELDDFVSTCHASGQRRPTPLMLKYADGDYNRLHQDLYGEIAFPFQLAVCLSRPDRDFDGGEFVLTEQRPRVQSRVEVIALAQGEGIVFANRYRPVASARGHTRVNVRHGVSTVRSGERYCLGVIFHDAG